jgi:hypothetical protein
MLPFGSGASPATSVRCPPRDRLAERPGTGGGLREPPRLPRAPGIVHPAPHVLGSVPEDRPVLVVNPAAGREVVDARRAGLRRGIEVIHLELRRAGAALAVRADPGAPVAVALQHRAADRERYGRALSWGRRLRRCGLPRLLELDEPQALAVLRERVVEHLLEDLVEVAVRDLVAQVAAEPVELRLALAIQADPPLPAVRRDGFDGAAGRRARRRGCRHEGGRGRRRRTLLSHIWMCNEWGVRRSGGHRW